MCLSEISSAKQTKSKVLFFVFASEKRISSLIASLTSFLRGAPRNWRALTGSPVRGGAVFRSTMLKPRVLNNFL